MSESVNDKVGGDFAGSLDGEQVIAFVKLSEFQSTTNTTTSTTDDSSPPIN